MKSIAVVVPLLQYATDVLAQSSAQEQTSYSCPADRNSTITDVSGTRYVLNCGLDLGGDVFEHAQAINSFNDCFDFCDANSPKCTGWTYLGTANGAGPGYCYLKRGELYLRDGNENIVAAVRVPSSSDSSTSTTMSPSSSSSEQSSSTATLSLSSSSEPTASTTTSASSSSSEPSTSTTMMTLSRSSTTTSTAQSTSSESIATTPTSTTPSSSTTDLEPTYVHNNGKRGLCYNNDSLTLPYAQAGQNSQVSWGYNYYYSRYSTPNDGVENPAMTFIPLLFNDDPSLTNVWHDNAQAAIDAGTDALMSFNEPDFCFGGSACMSINQSVAAYKAHMQPFAGVVPLGAPAVTNAGPPYGLTYLDWFIGNCTGCQIDFINLHWYANSYAFTYLQSYVQEAHTRFPGKPIWVTEIGMDGGKDLDTEANVEAFMRKAVAWLDAVPYVDRYAWFIDAPGNLINEDGNGLSALGTIYNNYTSPCPDWQNTDGHC